MTMSAKHFFGAKFFFLSFLLTFLIVFFQPEVGRNVCAEKTEVFTNGIKNIARLSQEPQFQNIPFIQGSGRLNASLKPLNEISEEREENKASFLSKTSSLSYFSYFYSPIFVRNFSFYFYKSFAKVPKLYSLICCWRI